MSTTIRAKKDLHNCGKCFTKDKEYTISQNIHQESQLSEIRLQNDLGEPHIIGEWWRNFEIVDHKR